MESPRSLSDYGLPVADKFAVEDPSTEQPAAKYNRHGDDTVQMSRTTRKADFDFLTINSVATVSAANVNCESHYGTGASTKPVVARTGTGAYTATFASTYLDGLGNTDTVSFIRATGDVCSLTVTGVVHCTVSANVVSIICRDMAGAAADYTVGTKVAIEVK